MLRCLLDGCSMRATARITGVSFPTIAALLRAAGPVLLAYHDTHVRGLTPARIELDEIWSYLFAKQKRVKAGEITRTEAGNVWTWMALDPDTKLLISWLAGGRDYRTALLFAQDLRSRVVGHPVLSSDGHASYFAAIQQAFGATADYGQVVYGEKHLIEGTPVEDLIGTSFVERLNLTMRMEMRRYTRKTNGFSKRFEQHCNMLALWACHYNYSRVHRTLRVTPAMEAGLTPHLRDIDWIADLIEASYAPPSRRGPYRPKLRLRS